MYPVGLCLHILPDVFVHDYCRFLAGPSRQCLETFGFSLNASKQAGFCSKKLWNRQACFRSLSNLVFRTIIAISLLKLHTFFHVYAFPILYIFRIYSEQQKTIRGHAAKILFQTLRLFLIKIVFFIFPSVRKIQQEHSKIKV